jgi:putative transposase
MRWQRFKCVECGFAENADLNAAINILRKQDMPGSQRLYPARKDVDRADHIGVFLEATFDAGEPLPRAAVVCRHFSKTCADFEAQLIEMDGEDDHVHLLVEYPPKVAVSNLVNSLKGVSSRLLRKERPDIQERYWKGVLWSPSYFASSCGGAPISIVRQYIEQQQTPH